MNIGGRLLVRHWTPHEGPGPGGEGPGWAAAGIVFLVGAAVLGVAMAIAWQSEPFARWFPPVAGVALGIGFLVHVAASWRREGEVSITLRPASPMAFALVGLAVALFVCWQLLGFHWGWPVTFVPRRRRRWWQLLAGP